MKKQVGIWIRVSTEDQAKGESPEHHEYRARSYADSRDWEVATVYHLEAVSGKEVLHHPEAKRMMADIKSGKITGLIFSKIARLARNTKELLQIADYFREHNADLASLHENIDTSTPAGRFFYTLISAMAQWEREEIVERVSASVPVRAKLGKPLGGQAPFGYEWKDKKLVINENEAIVRRLMVDLFLEHKRKKTVANILNEKGYRTRNKSMFSDTTISRLLQDPITKGVKRANYTSSNGQGRGWSLKEKQDWVFTEAPAIISEEQWNAVNEIIEEQTKNNNQPLNKKTHIFTGFVFCSCGGKMTVLSGSQKYVCPKCKNKISQEDLEHIFHEKIKSFIISEESVQVFQKETEEIIAEKERILQHQRNEAKAIEIKLENLLDLHLRKEIATEGFGLHYNPLFEQLKQIKEEIPKQEGEILALKQNENNSKYIFDEALNIYSKWDSYSQDKKRSIVETTTNRIEVGEEEIAISIKYLTPPFYESPEMGNTTMSLWLLQPSVERMCLRSGNGAEIPESYFGPTARSHRYSPGSCSRALQ